MAGVYHNVGVPETPTNCAEFQNILNRTYPNESELLDVIRRKDYRVIVFSQPPKSLTLIGKGFTIPPKYFPSPQINIRMAGRELKYSMSTDTFVNVLQEAVRSGSGFFRLEGQSGNTNGSQYKSPKGLVFTSVVLSQQEVQTLWVQQYHKALKYIQDQRYGSVVITFPYESVSSPGQQCFKLGTRVYYKEYSQVVLVDQTSQEISDYLMAYEAHAFHTAPAYPYRGFIRLPPGLRCRRTLEGQGLEIIHPLERIQNLGEMEWPLAFNFQGEWTHPEVAFLGSVNIPMNACRVEFVRHSCRATVRPLCTECDLLPSSIKMIVADKLSGMRQGVLELQERYGMFSNHNSIFI